jgi:uncharacterized protein
MANSKSKAKKVSMKIVILSVIIALLVVINLILLITISAPEETEIQKFVSFDNSTMVSISMPAVTDEDKGILTYLSVEATSGTGRILVDIDNLLFWEDTQQSMRVARKVAANITGVNIENYDLIYNIHANANVIGGPSAGAALTIATIAALEGRKINESVLITGSINHDGSLGPAGNILEKAKAAKTSGASLFLVPLSQSKGVVYETTKICEKFGWTDVCSVEQIPNKIDIAKEAGIEVMEVENISEAMKYLLE